MVGYTTSKAAIHGLTKTLSRELGDKGSTQHSCCEPQSKRAA